MDLGENRPSASKLITPSNNSAFSTTSEGMRKVKKQVTIQSTRTPQEMNQILISDQYHPDFAISNLLKIKHLKE